LPVASPLLSIGVSHSPSLQLSASCSQRNLRTVNRARQRQHHQLSLSLNLE